MYLENYIKYFLDWLTLNNSYIQSLSPLIQAICSFFLFLITIKYVVATSKMVHLPYKTYVKPIQVGLENNSLTNWWFEVKNYGPGLAINVRVYTIMNSNYKYLKDLTFLMESKKILGKGSTELQPGQEEKFRFEGLISFKDPVIITWESITGKRFRSYWKVTIRNGERIKAYGFSRKLSFWITRLWLYCRSPFLKVYYWFISRKDHKEIKSLVKLMESDILSILNKDNQLFYGELAEKLRTDECKMKSILSVLKKKKIIIFDEYKATITKKGQLFLKRNNDNLYKRSKKIDSIERIKTMKRVLKYMKLHNVGLSLLAVDIIFGIFYIILMILNSKGVISSTIHYNLFPEIIGINLTVLIIDLAVNRRGERKESDYEFEMDVQNFGRYLLNIKNKLDLIINAIEKNSNSDSIFLLRQELRLDIDNPPVRRSFSNKHITKEKGERIIKANNYVSDTLHKLDELLENETTEINKYEKLKGELFRSALSILELRASNERINELGSVLNNKMQ